MQFINKYITALVIGINSGLVYALLGSTLTMFLYDNTISYTLIGILSLRTLPYSFKFLWAPAVDSYRLKFFQKNFGQRKSWLISMQVFLMFTIASIGFLDINKNFFLIATLFIFISLGSATYDIALEAYRIELFSSKNPKGNSLVVFGFRCGLFFSAAFALYLSSIMSWKWVFIITSSMILPCIFVVLFSQDKRYHPVNERKLSIREVFEQYIYLPFITFFKRKNCTVILMVVAFYKVSDGYLDTMILPFLIDHGFSKQDIAGVVKTVGIIAAIFGAFIGAYIVNKINIIKSLIIAEILAATTNLLFLTIYNNPGNILLLMIVNTLESICSGIANITLITYMSSLCHKNFTATHYAILISTTGFTRAILSSTSGYTISSSGWTGFFIISTLLSIPSLACLWIMSRRHNI